MNQKAAIIKSLLKGEVLSVMTAFKLFGCTNLAREIGRSVEREFDVEVSKLKKVFKSRYAEPGYYYEYRLNRSQHNLAGILEMEAYISKIENTPFNPPVKRGPKVKHIKNTTSKNMELEFTTSNE